MNSSLNLRKDTFNGRFQKLATALSLLMISGVVFSCATGKGRYVEAPDRVQRKQPEPTRLKGRAATEFKKIQSLYSTGLLDSALENLGKFDQKYKSPLAKTHSFNLRGLIYLKKRDSASAAREFERALKVNKNNAFKQVLLYNLATSLYNSKQVKSVPQVLTEVEPQHLDSETQIKFYYLKSKTYDSLGYYQDASNELLAASSLLKTRGFSTKEKDRYTKLYEKQLNLSLRKIQDHSTIESLYEQYSDSPIISIVIYQLASQALASGETFKAEIFFKRLVREFPNSPHIKEAKDFLRSIRNISPNETRTVGVLMPLSGRFSKFGIKALRGVELAFRIFNLDEPDSKVTLIVEDSGETEEQAIEALEKLVFQHQVVAVIGPLISKGIEGVTHRAQSLQVPMISLAQKPGEIGEFVFFSSITPEDQCYEIARHAIEVQDFTRFAILYPEGKFGKMYSTLFWDAVELFGGEVVSVESYAQNETDFRTVVDKIGGLYYKNARQRELNDLAELREIENVTRKTRRNAQYFNLPPAIDFDAVFIADEAKVVAQALPTFAYRDMEGISFLGLPTWNSPALFKRASEYLQNTYIVDAFFPGSLSQESQKFVSKYKHTFNSTPTLIEALSYDAGALLEQALLVLDNNATRKRVRDELMKVSDFPGVTGRITYREGRLARQLKILKLEPNRITEVIE